MEGVEDNCAEEEHEDQEGGEDDQHQREEHGNVGLCAHGCCGLRRVPVDNLMKRETKCPGDDLGGAEDADDAGHGNAADGETVRTQNLALQQFLNATST